MPESAQRARTRHTGVLPAGTRTLRRRTSRWHCPRRSRHRGQAASRLMPRTGARLMASARHATGGQRPVRTFLTDSSARLRRASRPPGRGPRAPLASSLRAPHPSGLLHMTKAFPRCSRSRLTIRQRTDRRASGVSTPRQGRLRRRTRCPTATPDPDLRPPPVLRYQFSAFPCPHQHEPTRWGRNWGLTAATTRGLRRTTTRRTTTNRGRRPASDCLRDEEVAGSNPVTPTSQEAP